MTQTPGGALGKLLSRVLADTIIEAHQHTTETATNAKSRATHEMLEFTESELADAMGPIFSEWAETEGIPDSLKAVFAECAAPSHQATLIMQILGGVGAIIGSVGTFGPILLQKYKNNLLAQYANVPIPPADCADMALRSVLTFEQAEAEALLSGVEQSRFMSMFENTGEPPGIVDMLRLWRRGLINDGQLKQVVEYSRVRDQYLPQVELMAYDTMGAADAIEAHLKGVIPEDEARTLFQQAGALEEQFPTLLDTAGDAIGVEAAGNLYNHGLITQDQLAQVILHSRINPIFEPMAELLRFKWLAAFQIEAGLKAGTIAAPEGIKWLLEEGYPADQVNAFVTGAASGKSVKAKELTEAQIVEAREVGMFTTAEATTELGLIGYNAHEAEWILSLADQRRGLQIKLSEISIIRNAYLHYRITATELSNALDSAGVDPVIKADYLKAWNIERSLTPKALTLAEVGGMAKKGILTHAEALERWERMGYDPSDADLLLADYTSTPLSKRAARQAQQGS